MVDVPVHIKPPTMSQITVRNIENPDKLSRLVSSAKKYRYWVKKRENGEKRNSNATYRFITSSEFSLSSFVPILTRRRIGIDREI